MSPTNPEINITLNNSRIKEDYRLKILMKAAKRSPLGCPFYEEHSGEYYQGCWEHNDLCWLSSYVPSLSCYCHANCWYFMGDPKLIMNLLLREYRRTENFVKKMGILTALSDVLRTSVRNWTERERCYR